MDAHSVLIQGETYENSMVLCCGDQGLLSKASFAVSGSRFSSLVGVADDAQDAVGIKVYFTFYDQDGKALTKKQVTSVGHPVQVEFSIKNVVQLEVRFVSSTGFGSLRYASLFLADPILIGS